MMTFTTPPDSSNDSDNLVETSTDDDNEDREREEDPSVQLKEFWSQIFPLVPEFQRRS